MNARASHNELRRGAAGRERLGHCFHLLSLGLGHLRTARRQTGVKMGPRRATQSARLSAALSTPDDAVHGRWGSEDSQYWDGDALQSR